MSQRRLVRGAILAATLLTACAGAKARPNVDELCRDNNDATCSSDWALCWNGCTERHWGTEALDSWCAAWPSCMRDCQRFQGVRWREVR